MKGTPFKIFFVCIDFLMAFCAWGLFFWFRKTYIESVDFETTSNFYKGIIGIPICWLILYAILGTYHDVKRLHRMKVLGLTVISTILGAAVIFFTFILDDHVNGYQMYYKSFLALICIHFVFTIIPRFIMVTLLVNKIHSKKLGFNTLLIGGSQKAVDVYNEIIQLPKSTGNHFIGFVNLNGIDRNLEKELPYLGHFNDIEEVLKNNKVEEVIIALDSTEQEKIKQIISQFHGTGIKIKLIPNMYDILSGTVKMNNIFGALLIEIDSDIMPVWQTTLKRAIDIGASFVSLILLIPIYIILSILVKSSSKGPVFFTQERIGKNGKPFHIIKFRTMFTNAEDAGPQLSSSHDPRITPIGRFMRKSRFDEFPQFWNVLVGDMSLVGPRPERQFFIDQIKEFEPQFVQLNKVRPGITSWGQVKYGYAENVKEMLERMKYDLLYIKNMSLALDFKIMLYTVMIVIKAKGK